MDATTLNTFFLKAPHRVSTVELLGSWDNFERPYRLHRDFSRGKGTWVGCHTFENIVFDGDRLEWRKPRNGALKQGGRYWYFYRLDDAEEYCDPASPTATDCPLLPGQSLNLLDVPVEVESVRHRAHSASADLTLTMRQVMTFNPEDRYKKISRQPLGKLGRFYASTEDLRSNDLSPEQDPVIAVQEQKPIVETSATRFGRMARRVKSFTRPRGSHAPQVRPHQPSINEPPFTPLSQPISISESPCVSPLSTTSPSPKSAQTDPTRPPSRSGTEQSLTNAYPKALPLLPLVISCESHHGLGISGLESAALEPGTNAHPTHRASSKGVKYAGVTASSSEEAAKCFTEFNFEFQRRTPILPSPRSEMLGFDVSSPTFTEDTIDTPGFGTPARLSGLYAIDALRPKLPDMQTGVVIEDAIASVERRLSRLTTAQTEDMADVVHLSPFANQTCPAARMQSKASPSEPTWLAAPVLDDFGSSLLATDIFGELGFLSRVIS